MDFCGKSNFLGKIWSFFEIFWKNFSKNQKYIVILKILSE